MRSCPKNATKRFISLKIDVVDPPKLKGQHPVISPDLERVLSDIQKGTEQRLEVLKSKKKQVEQAESSVETVPKLIRHIEKMEADEEIEGKKEGDGGAAVAEEDVSGGQMADKGAAVATEDISCRQMADRGEATDEEVTKQTDKSKKADETENLKKKPRSTLSVSRQREE